MNSNILSVKKRSQENTELANDIVIKDLLMNIFLQLKECKLITEEEYSKLNELVYKV